MSRLIFMGAPDFSVPTLIVLADGDYDIVAVVTQPDRPRGRGRQVTPSPVKRVAQGRGLPILQPPRLRSPEAVAELAALEPDVIVVAAFGQILPPAVLDLPPHGCINVHASLLPRWRGAAPVQAALLAGDSATGSTIMLMDEGMDTGPILAQAVLPIGPDDTGAALTNRLAEQGAQLLAETLPRWLAGQIEPQPQDESQATICRPLRKAQGRIDWAEPAATIARAVRAYNPWPAAVTTWDGKLLKILQAQAVAPDVTRAPAEPGVVLAEKDEILVATGEGFLRLQAVQLAGRQAASAADFVRGQRGFVDSRLGD